MYEMIAKLPSQTLTVFGPAARTLARHGTRSRYPA
jgi:hypothetical protein